MYMVIIAFYIDESREMVKSGPKILVLDGKKISGVLIDFGWQNAFLMKSIDVFKAYYYKGDCNPTPSPR